MRLVQYWGSKGKYQYQIWGKSDQHNIMLRSYKVKSNFYQAYRVNYFEEQSENWYVAKLNIRGVPFDG